MEEAEKAFRKVLGDSIPAIRWPGIISPWCSRGPTALKARLRFAKWPPRLRAKRNCRRWRGMKWPSIATNAASMPRRSAPTKRRMTFTPERAVIWLDAGVAHQQLGELDQARRHYEQAVELDPELARAWHNLGAVRQELGDVKGGQEAIDEAERLLARGR